MAQIDNHLKWCLKDSYRLKKVKPDDGLARKHLQKTGKRQKAHFLMHPCPLASCYTRQIWWEANWIDIAFCGLKVVQPSRPTLCWLEP